jgi:hypothetical protein
MSGQVGVEVVLTAGRSKTDRVQFNEQVAATRAIIGAATTADWNIAAPGLDAQHAEIAWDGTQLWVRDNGSRAGTWVGSEKLTQEWRLLRVGEQIRLGQAMLTVQAQGAEAEDEEFADEATRVNNAGGGVARAPSSDHDDGESTMIVNTVDHQAPKAPLAPSKPMMAPRVNTVLPKVNVTKPAGIQPSPSSNVATLVGDESSGIAAYAQSLQAQLNAGQPPMGMGGMQQPMQPPMQQPMMQPSMGMGGMQPIAMGGYPPVNPAPAAGGEFAPPPSELSLFGSIPPPDAVVAKPPAGQQKLLFGALPPRTAIMLTGALVVALGVLFMPEDPPPRPVARPVDPALTAPQPAWTPPIPGPAAGEARAIHLNSNANPPPLVPPATRPPRNAPPPPPQTSFPERQAADLVVQNRIREAIPLYQALQTAHPDQPVYRDMLVLLYRKLEAQLCPPGSPTPCTAVPQMPTIPNAAPAGAQPLVPGAQLQPTAQPGAAVAPQPVQQPTQGMAR